MSTIFHHFPYFFHITTQLFGKTFGSESPGFFRVFPAPWTCQEWQKSPGGDADPRPQGAQPHVTTAGENVGPGWTWVFDGLWTDFMDFMVKPCPTFLLVSP